MIKQIITYLVISHLYLFEDKVRELFSVQIHIRPKVCVGSDLSKMERIKGVNVCGGEDRKKIKPVRS